MKKYYDLGWIKASIERTSSGYFETVVKEIDTGDEFKSLHATMKSAFLEIMSYCEIDEWDFEH